MNKLNRIELAIRRAASQMPNHQSRAFRLLADELQDIDHDTPADDVEDMLNTYRTSQRELD